VFTISHPAIIRIRFHGCASRKNKFKIRTDADYKTVSQKGVIVQENDSKQYQINISGNRFSISSPYGEEHVREVEKFLDQQINEVSKQTEAFGPSNIALLVALNLADRLLTLQKRVSKFDGIEDDLDTLCYKLDKVLAD
tara:strand:+ start:264 stop:680 length:417 start_codon:yes stop_codon:yes gene_type:complete